MNITNENYKGLSLEEFTDFNLDELYLLDDIINSLKNKLPIDVNAEMTENLSIIQAKVLILTAQPWQWLLTTRITTLNNNDVPL